MNYTLFTIYVYVVSFFFFFYVDMAMQSVFPSFRRHCKNMSNYSVENAMSRGFSIEHNAFNVELDKFGVFVIFELL